MKRKMLNNVLDYLSKYGGVDYRAPQKQKNKQEAERYQELYKSSKNVMCAFGELIHDLGDAANMVSFYHKEMLDGSRRKLRTYYWGELRSEKCFQDCESISVFAEKTGDGARYRVSLEIDELHSDDALLKRHNRLLDLPMDENCVFALNNKGVKDLVFTKSREEALQWINDSDYRKVQICCLIDADNSSDVFQELVTAVQTIRPYYDYVVNI